MKNKKFISVFVIASVVMFSAQSAFAFWIWSPKTKEWKNPKYSPLATPQLQFDSAFKLFEAQQYKEALSEFKKVLINYPDAKESAEAQYYIGRSYDALNEGYLAFKEYQKVIEKYPQSSRIKEIIQLEFDLGEKFLSHTKDRFLGLRVADFMEHPSIEIFKAVVENDPYSELAVKAQYKLGLLLKELRRYEDAIDAFDKVAANYPESRWAEAAQFQIAHTKIVVSGGYEYDSSFHGETIKTYEEFVKKYPDLKLSQEAREDIKALNENEARKKYETARFYERQKKFKSALVYYEYVVSHYPESSWSKQSQDKIRDLREVVGESHVQ